MPPVEVFVFTDPSAERIAEEAAQIKGDTNQRVLVRRYHEPNGRDHVTLQFLSDHYQGPEIDDSRPCPGSPGCP